MAESMGPGPRQTQVCPDHRAAHGTGYVPGPKGLANRHVMTDEELIGRTLRSAALHVRDQGRPHRLRQRQRLRAARFRLRQLDRSLAPIDVREPQGRDLPRAQTECGGTFDDRSRAKPDLFGSIDRCEELRELSGGGRPPRPRKRGSRKYRTLRARYGSNPPTSRIPSSWGSWVTSAGVKSDRAYSCSLSDRWLKSRPEPE